jgi:membrane fusion protein, multidrug efflux system
MNSLPSPTLPPGSSASSPVREKSGTGVPVRRPGRRWVGWVVLLVVLASGYGVWQAWGRRKDSGGASGPAAVGGTNRGPMAVPVILGLVQEKDVPIYADGLGTVQAFTTATVRARVEGLLLKVGFREGQDVQEGDVLAQIDPEPFRLAVAQAEAKRAQDEAQLKNARVDLVRNQGLITNAIVSRQVLDTAQALVDQLAASVLADQAAIDNARVQLGYTTVRAPISGRTGLRLMDAGNMVRSGDSNGLVVITQLKPISVVFTLPQPMFSEVQRRTKEGDMAVLALDRDNKSLLATGQLTVVDNQIDMTTGTIKLKATFSNEDLRLWPGQFVNVRLRLTTKTKSAVVPSSVIQRGPEGVFAFVIDDDNKASIRLVKVGQMDDGQALIESGLKPGERVVVDGQYRLQPGSLVRPVEAVTPGAAGGGQKGRESGVSGGVETNRGSFR